MWEALDLAFHRDIYFSKQRRHFVYQMDNTVNNIGPIAFRKIWLEK